MNSYDFIIVGGGTAGSVLANRLSENKKWNILVLEAGQPESLVNIIPGLAAYLIRSNYDWGYVTEKTPGSCISKTINPLIILRDLHYLLFPFSGGK